MSEATLAETARNPDVIAGSREDNRLEIIGVVILAIASLKTAWSGFEATKWSGVQASSYSQASATRIESNRSDATGLLYALNDQANVNNWINATVSGETEAATLYENRLEQTIPEAWVAWIALDPLNTPDAPQSPLQMPEFSFSTAEQTATLDKQASDLFQKGQDANQTADNFVLATVFFAAALFFSGISTSINLRSARIALLAIAGILVVGAGIWIFTMPVQI